jgi:hypothetical protein
LAVIGALRALCVVSLSSRPSDFDNSLSGKEEIPRRHWFFLDTQWFRYL